MTGIPSGTSSDVPRGVTLPRYLVADVRSAGAGTTDGRAAPPPALLEQFDGRAFTLHDLEQRGVRVVGGRAAFTLGGADWWLDLLPAPEVGQASQPD